MKDTPSSSEIELKLNKARAAHRSGNLAESVPVYQLILAKDPDHAEALHLLGVATMQCGKLTEALNLLKRAATRAPENAKIQNNLGAVLLATGRLHEAKRCFSTAVELAPEFDEAQYNLGRVLHEQGHSLQAIEKYRMAIQLNGTHVAAHSNLGTLLTHTGEPAEGLALLKRAEQLAPDSAEVLSSLVVALERANDLEVATSRAKRLAQIGGNLSMSKYARARIAYRDGEMDLSIHLLREVVQSASNPALKIDALADLSRALDRNGNYSEAFDACTEAKRLRMQSPDAANWDRESYLKRVKNHRAWASRERINGRPQFSGAHANPVFFVGFPRSGTTLLEQILDAHPDIVTTGERTALRSVVPVLEERLGRPVTLPNDIDMIAESDLAALRKAFFEDARKTTGDDLSRRRLVDKMPMNIVYLGLINRIFPDAKVLVALRDPRDCCLSCYMQQFRPNPAMLSFLELETTGELYVAVMDLWLHYRSILSIPWLEYRYEDLVKDFNGTVSRVLDFIGVPWNDAVGNYADHALGKNITTPSYDRVVQQISKSAVGRWRNYKNELAPILYPLEPFVKRFGYDPS